MPTQLLSESAFFDEIKGSILKLENCPVYPALTGCSKWEIKQPVNARLVQLTIKTTD